MPLSLHPDCKKRLVEVVAEGLPIIIAKNGMFIDRMSYLMGLYKADDVIPLNCKLAKQLIEYVNEYPVLDFISETLSIELQDLDKYHSEPASVKLVEIEGYKDPAATAQRLIDDFDSLPWKYTLTIILPEKLSDILRPYVTNTPLSPDIKLVKPSTDFITKFPRKSADENKDKRIRGRKSLFFTLGTDSEPTWDENSILLQINVEGFVGLYGYTAPAQKGIAIVRAFCGLAIALRLAQVDYTYSPTAPKCEFEVHKQNAAGWELDGKFDLSDKHSKILSDLKIYDGIAEFEEEEKELWINATIKRMSLVFSNSQKAEKIILAAQWLFDSYAGYDELLNFVQAMVVLEILLGDKETSDEIGLGALLRNRCAYLIGKSHNERTELLADFNEIYRVRSQIVHRGKSKLTVKERGLFNKLRTMCHKVIQEEVYLLKADMKYKK